MIRKKAIFAGTSNTMGLGLELETSKRFQDEKYLKTVKNIPPIEDDTSRNVNSGYETYTREDKTNHRLNRWPRLVCDYFDLEEININDPIKEYPIDWFNEARQAVDIVFGLYDKKDEDEIKNLLNNTKYIFLEFGYIRWWDEQLHGVNKDFKWPTTPGEIDKFLKNSDIGIEEKQKAIDWLNNVNPIELWERTIHRIKLMKKEFPNIEFILLAWGVNPDVFNLESTQELIDNFLSMPQHGEYLKNNYGPYFYYDIGHFLDENNLTIKDTVLAYEPRFKDKWLYEDYHASKKGHEIIANQIIKKLQDETRGLYSI